MPSKATGVGKTNVPPAWSVVEKMEYEEGNEMWGGYLRSKRLLCAVSSG